MAGAYSMDLRRRVVSAYLAGEGTYPEIAARFAVGEATAKRWVLRHRRTGSVKADAMGGARHERKIDEVGMEFIRQTLVDVPDSTANELVAAYSEEFGVAVSRSTMQRAIARSGFTRKRGRSARQRRIGPTSLKPAKRSSSR
jgi:transposase